MALGDTGMFNPAESNYLTPGAYGETLRAEALKRAAYLSSMDQFYESLDETKRQFDETLTFKEATLAQEKWVAEQNISLGKEELSLKKELGMADINLRTKALEAEQDYRSEALGVEKMKINAAYGTTKLGSDSGAKDFLEKYLLGKDQGYIPGTSYAPGISEPYQTPARSLAMRSGKVSSKEDSLYDPGASEYV